MGSVFGMASCQRGNPALDPATDVATIGGATVTYAKWYGQPVILVWTDLAGETQDWADTSAGSVVFYGSVTSPQGRKLEWRLETVDRINGKVIINHGRYELSNGRVFLVTMGGERMNIRQLQRDLSDVSPNRAGLEAFAKEDPDVARFVAAASPPRPPRDKAP
jgi:hypothetical protein